MRLVLATHNKGKVRELRTLLADTDWEILTLSEFPRAPIVTEDGVTFRDNAIKKAREISHALGEVTLADDSGLEVDYLNGAPGVHSARFAGYNGNDAANNEKLLRLLKGVPWEKRTARFRCVVALADPSGKVVTTEGVCEGLITNEPRGENGFGYDPLFFVPEYRKTFAELDGSIKNSISHRARALRKVKKLLQEFINK